MSAKKSNDAQVTRIKAGSSTKKAKSPRKESVVRADATPKARRSASVAFVPAKGIAGYMRGAWEELRQVRWPTRRATWSLTGAVLAFSAFFVVLILLLDAGFKLLFEKLLG